MIQVGKKAPKLFILFVLCHSFLIGKSNADDPSIRDFCRLRFGTFAHPNPSLCFKFVQCQVTFLMILQSFLSFEHENLHHFFSSHLLKVINSVDSECESGTIFIENEGCVPGNRDTCQRLQDDEISSSPLLDNSSTRNLNQFCQTVTTGMFANP
jgi:hypothetical protein